MLNDLPGWVEVTLESNQDPEALGCAPAARDFPVCTATVTYRGRGYMAALGWIQLVRSTDGASGGTQFELDPFEPLGSLTDPFCWFGFAPTLFDAPSRSHRASLDWTGQSFLCFIAPVERGLEARAILGFSWGFVIRDEIVSLDARRSSPGGVGCTPGSSAQGASQVELRNRLSQPVALNLRLLPLGASRGLELLLALAIRSRTAERLMPR